MPADLFAPLVRELNALKRRHDELGDQVEALRELIDDAKAEASKPSAKPKGEGRGEGDPALP